MEILYLAECVEVIPQLAAWFSSEWPGAAGEDYAQRFQRCANMDKIPIGFVAFQKSAPIGTVSILSTSVHSHNHLKPWIGGLYVVPEKRHQGVATRLIDSVLETVRLLGNDNVYAGVQAARHYYENHGWKYLEEGKAGNDTVIVLKKSLSAGG
jgi:GNAT superfamily N-acetyltransferase